MNISESINELIEISGKSKKAVACGAGIEQSGLSQWCLGQRYPTLASAVKLADYFHCSLDYLIGRSENRSSKTFLPCPPFSEILPALMDEYNTNPFQLSRAAKIGRTTVYQWKNGTSVPSMECLIRLANYFDCTLDHLVGRE